MRFCVIDFEPLTSRQFLLRLMLALALVLFFFAYSRGAEPPPALLPQPEVNPAAACVSIQTGLRPGGIKFGGSGVCVGSEGGWSVALTSNHVFSDQEHPAGGFRDDIYPQAATVIHGKKTYKATAVGGNREADIAVVVVEGELPAATLAEADAKPGDKVWRKGNATGLQIGIVKPTDFAYTSPSMHFVVDAKSDSGDSGAAYFNEKNECVAIHAGRTGAFARGTPVTSVRVVVKQHAPRLFARLRARLLGPPVAVMVSPTPPPAAVPKKVEPPKKAEPPKVMYVPVPVAAPPTVSVGVSLPGTACSGPSCSAATTVRVGLFGRLRR